MTSTLPAAGDDARGNGVPVLVALLVGGVALLVAASLAVGGAVLPWCIAACALVAAACSGGLRLRGPNGSAHLAGEPVCHPQVVALAEASPLAMLFLHPVAEPAGEQQEFHIVHSNSQAQQFRPEGSAGLSGNPGSAFPFLASEAHLQRFRDVLLTGRPCRTTFAVSEPGFTSEALRLCVSRFNGGLLLTLEDATAARQAERQMCRQIQQDALTGLPNRTLLDDRIQQALRRARRNKQAAAVLLLDLDDFAAVNERHGRAAGDHVLKVVAGRLTEAVRKTDSVVRLGGDKFVVVFSDVFTHDPVTDFARKILLGLFAPIPWEGTELQVTASIGVAMYPAAGTTPETLLIQADIEMHRRKRAHSSPGFAPPPPGRIDSRAFSLTLT